jgi:hypothetical protein
LKWLRHKRQAHNRKLAEILRVVSDHEAVAVDVADEVMAVVAIDVEAEADDEALVMETKRSGNQ